MAANMEPMETNEENEDARPEQPSAAGTPTTKMIKDRAIEIAWMNGRGASELKPADYVAAKLELTGEPAVAPDETVLEDVPESKRWDPVPGSTGQKAPVTPSVDEDEEGRSDNEKMVDEGMNAAENDNAKQAEQDAEKDL